MLEERGDHQRVWNVADGTQERSPRGSENEGTQVYVAGHSRESGRFEG